MPQPWLSASNPMLARLYEREAEGNPIRVAVIGTGDYGETLVAQLAQIVGMRPAVVCDRQLERAVTAYEMGGLQREDVFHARRLGDIERFVAQGRPVITDDLELAVQSPVDVVVDCTGEPETGCRVALGAIAAGKHIVMVNVEADSTVGAQLAARARQAGVVYTLADGDQPSLIVELVDWARCLGLEIVAAGKWTRQYAPDEAAARLAASPDPTMSTITYLDGSKTQIEMASTANAAGLALDVPGMHGPSLHLEAIPRTLCPSSDGGILGGSGVVEYVNCQSAQGEVVEARLGGGVFLVVTTGSRRGLQAMANKQVITSADARYALIYRPNHLVGVETPWSILKAVLEGVPTAAPGPVPQAEVIAVAKRRLHAGQSLGGLASADVAGMAMNAQEAAAQGYVPVGLTTGVRLKNDVDKGAWLTYDMIASAPESQAWGLRHGSGLSPLSLPEGNYESRIL